MLYAPFQSYAVVMATTTLTIVSNAGTFFQSYVYCIAILLLILHDLYLLFCFWLACLNYPTFCICNQSCIAFIYFLFISCFFRQMEKEPLPQLVEVLSHAAARAATFFIVQPRRLCTRSVCYCSWPWRFNPMQSYKLRQDPPLKVPYPPFQSYAVARTAPAKIHNNYIFYII